MEYKSKYLNLLAKEFPSVQEVSTELINLTAILNLPRGTEHFLSDIHGEYETFNHFLKNGSGVTKEKISIVFNHYSEEEQNQLAFFVYYPKQMTAKYEELLNPNDFISFIRAKLLDLISLCRFLSLKYTKSKVRKSLPKAFNYIIQELLYENRSHSDKVAYYSSIIDAIFKTKREKNFLIELSYLTQKLTIDRLHIVGDIFDRGPAAHLVMRKILRYHSVDVQWGNHDIIWMGAASGSKLAMCNVLRNSARYNTLDTLEEGYGINLMPLANFALNTYKNDPCEIFMPKNAININQDDALFVAKMHKAIAIIQFKLEKKISDKNPHFNLSDRLLLEHIDYANGTIDINNKKYQLLDNNFPTIDPDNPYQLTAEEQQVTEQLSRSFLHNDLLQTHIEYLFKIGFMYLVYNGNLLFHGCIPLEKSGSFSKIVVDGVAYEGKALFDFLDQQIRTSFINRYAKENPLKDYFVFLWQSKDSPLFGKKSMKTFERYFIKEKETHKEEKNDYFILRTNKEVLKSIYDEFEIDYEKAKIINGHIPTDILNGGSPIIADGKIYTIDGGMSKQYKDRIGIGGYTLISDSYKLFLISHDRFDTKEKLINSENDIVSIVRAEELNKNREFIYDTDKGKRLQILIDDLYMLLEAYQEGIIKENIEKQ